MVTSPITRFSLTSVNVYYHTRIYGIAGLHAIAMPYTMVIITT